MSDFIRRGLFVTGTDTEVGKTWASLALMRSLQRTGQRVIGMKPVASGSERVQGKLVNADAQLLRAHSSVDLPYENVNPYAFEPPVAPHLAAAEKGVRIDLDKIAAAHESLRQHRAITVVEGVGGWLVPLTPREAVADLALKLRLPVVVVVALRLGCLNHAFLTAESIRARGAPFAGWIANSMSDDPRTEQLLETLRARLEAPCLGSLPHLNSLDVDRLADGLQLSRCCFEIEPKSLDK